MAATPEPTFQRNALAPGLLAAAILFAAPALLALDWGQVVLFGTSILALIVAWFAFQANQWWWAVVFIGVAIAWNPVFPLVTETLGWLIAQWVVAVAFLAAGVLIRSPRDA